MGANEKHAATYHGGEYTPSTRAVRETFAHTGQPESTAYLRAAFERWLAKVRAEAQAQDTSSPASPAAETWERTAYDFSRGAPFSQSTGYGQKVRRTVTPTPRGTIELTRAEFDGLMKLAGYEKAEP